MICACWHMLTTGEPTADLSGDYHARRDPERQTRRLIAQLERLGHSVTLQAANAAKGSSVFSLRGCPNLHARLAWRRASGVQFAEAKGARSTTAATPAFSSPIR